MEGLCCRVGGACVAVLMIDLMIAFTRASAEEVAAEESPEKRNTRR